MASTSAASPLSDSSSPDEVFQRILRRLQREEHYSTLQSLGVHQPEKPNTPADVTGTRHMGSSSRGGPPSSGVGGGALAMLSRMSRKEQGEHVPGAGESSTTHDRHEAEERHFGQGPSPGTLRVVLESVRETVSGKLELALISPLRDTMRLLFECRTMLDKLLKDIPNHKPYLNDDPGVSDLTVPMKLQEFLQDLKRTPVLLPTARYAKVQGPTDDSAGRIVAQLVSRSTGGGDDAPSSPSPHGRGAAPPSSLPDINASGKSVHTGRSPQLAVASTAAGSAALVVVQPPSFQGGAAPSMGLGSNIPSIIGMSAKDYQLLMRHLRRQVQFIADGTQTELSLSDFVSVEKLHEQKKKNEDLTKLCHEYEFLMERMQSQMDVIRGALTARSATVAYLRQTLFRECCQLRTQLNTYSMRHGQSVGQDYALLHSLLDTVVLAVERDRTVSEDGTFKISAEDELRRVKADMDAKKMRLKREIVDLRRRFKTQLDSKQSLIQSLKLQNDVESQRRLLGKHMERLRGDFDALRKDVKAQLSLAGGTISRMAQEIDFASRKATMEVQMGQRATQKHRILSDVLANALKELVVPMMKPEYATGSHAWAFAKQADPLASYVAHTHGDEWSDDLAPDLKSLFGLYTEIRRFALRVFAQPDQHRPQPGAVMQQLCHRLLINPALPLEMIPLVRLHADRDNALGAQRAKLNMKIKFLSSIQQIVEQRSRQALAAAGLSAGAHHRVATVVQAMQQLNELNERKKTIEASRAANAKALFQFWRNSTVDIWGGKKPPQVRDPDAPTWTPAPPLSKAQRTARKQILDKKQPHQGSDVLS